MAIRKFKDDFDWPPFLRVFGRVFNSMARHLNYPIIKPPLLAWDTGPSFGIRMNHAYGYPALNIKVTGAKSGDYYPADVYAAGTEAAATASSVDVYFPGFDINPSATQGYWPVVRIDNESAGTTVYQVIGMGTPPALGAGYFYPRLNSGTFEWVQVTNCTS